MSFEQFRFRHDPDGREDYTWFFELNVGESIDTAIVQVVDETSENVVASPDLNIETIAHGLVGGTLWGVTAWISAGTAPSGGTAKYYLRCRGETDAAPTSRKFDKTMVLIVQQR